MRQRGMPLCSPRTRVGGDKKSLLQDAWQHFQWTDGDAKNGGPYVKGVLGVFWGLLPKLTVAFLVVLWGYHH